MTDTLRRRARAAPPRPDGDGRTWIVPTPRRDLSLAAGAVSVVAYNWWVAVPFRPGLLPSTDGFFSDLEAGGRPDASIMYHLDLVAGVLLVVALLIAGTAGPRRSRLEHGALLGFGLAGALGGEFRYACAEGVSATCRRAEWHLQLPFHHYVHVVAGTAEFALLPLALHAACQRTMHEETRSARVYRAVWRVLVVAYVLLAGAYLTDRLGAFIEPVCFVAFSVVVMTELAERAPPNARIPAVRRRHRRPIGP